MCVGFILYISHQPGLLIMSKGREVSTTSGISFVEL